MRGQLAAVEPLAGVEKEKPVDRSVLAFTALAVAAVAGSGSALAVIVPFTETFASGPANWLNSDATSAVGTSLSGGPLDGPFARAAFSFENASANPQTPPVIIQARSNPLASGGAFFGSWTGAGVTAISLAVRHNVPADAAPGGLTYFLRFAGAANFPGATAIAFAPVTANTWTTITIPISALSPNFVSFEGSNFATVFGAIGRLQIGVTPPASLVGTTASYSFDVANISIVPAPASAGLVALAGVVASRRRRASL